MNNCPVSFRPLGAAMVLVLAQGAWAVPATKPLFLGTSVPPNVILGVDDSNSMNYELVMPGGTDGNPYSTGVLPFNSMRFVFTDGNDISITGLTLPPLPDYADARSSAYNKAYFDPAVTYEPWASYGGTTFPNVGPSAAPWDPTLSNTTTKTPSCVAGLQPTGATGFPKTFNLTKDVRCTNSKPLSALPSDRGYTFNVPSGTKIPKGTIYYKETASPGSPAGWTTALVDFTTSANDLTFAISYYPATFYLPQDAALPDTYSSFNNGGAPLTLVTTKSGIKLYRYEIKPGNFGDTAQYAAAIQNFANWFTYYRKRHAATRGAIGHAFKGIDNIRLGVFRLNNRPATLAMVDTHDTAARDNLFIDPSGGVYKYNFSGSTPNLVAVNYMGQQYEQSGIITESCQRHAGILFTDGVTDGVGIVAGSIGNLDGDLPAPYGPDSLSDTMADIAIRYYEDFVTPAPFLSGLVPVPSACNDTNPAPSLDCKRNPHMNFYAVSLGLSGKNYDPNTPRDPYVTPYPVWASDLISSANRQDDLWHATINGRGKLFSVSRPSEIRDKLTDILSSIVSANGASSSSVATTSAYLSTNALVFLAQFNSDGWSGDIKAYDLVKATDTLNDTPRASTAANQLPDYTVRRDHIFSYDPDRGKGIPFLWSSLTSNQRAALNRDDLNSGGAEVNDGLGEQRLLFLQGDTSKEQNQGGAFRKRDDQLLGDFVNSNPIYAGDQDFGYDVLDSSYASFLSTKKSRTPVLYIGGNDGMLHGFNASDTGSLLREVFAYVPSMVYDKLNWLTSPNYNDTNHRFLVDGSPWVGDAKLDGAWKSILLGTLGAGGKGVFALDVTDPEHFAADDVLWEFTNDPDLGYTLPQPTLVHTHSATYPWVAVLANGYSSTNGRAVLLIRDVKTGAEVVRLDTQAGGNAVVPQNGLSTPLVVDVDDDRKADIVYAGDLLGNLWKFDIKDPNYLNWQVAYNSGGAPRPLFIACANDVNPCADIDRQPITSKPQVGLAGQNDGIMVYVGTGKYFEDGDGLVGPSPQVQSFYGFLDPKPTDPVSLGTIERSALVSQTIDKETTQGGYRVRLTSRNPVDYSFAIKRGWYMDLKVVDQDPKGERVTSNPVLHDDRIAFTSFIPTSEKCGHGGSGWIMELDALTGAAPDRNSPGFDINKDGKFDANDLVEDLAPAGIGRDAIPSSIAIVDTHRIGGDTSGQPFDEKSPPTRYGRLSWRQIR